MRRPRKLLDSGLPMAGMLLVLAGSLFVHDLTTRLFVVLPGLILIKAGIWRLTHALLPDERRYRALRAEVTNMITQVRRLNAAAIDLKGRDSAESRVAVRDAISALHDSVGKIEHYAGKTDEELRSIAASSS